ncbi:MAG: ester cyclase [Solirubrobacteraceae bacterium]|nr:ester cyclase [Solirubrobacteraceae bacterium]
MGRPRYRPSIVEHRELAATFVQMLNTHDPDLVDRFVAVDYVNHNAFVDDGREANRAFWTDFFAALPDLRATMDDLVVSGDRVAGRFTYRGTHRGEFFGIPATGRSIEMRSIDIWRVEDGMFAEHWDELNTLDLIRQFGAVGLLRAGLVLGTRGTVSRLRRA